MKIFNSNWTIFSVVIQFCGLVIATLNNANCKSNISLNLEYGGITSSKKSARSTKIFDEVLSTRLFNTTMNFIVPGAKVNLPRHTEEGTVDHLAMQAFFGIFWAVAWLATIAIPFSKTYFQPLGLKRSLDDDYQGLHLKWKLNEKVAEAIGLNWRSCLQKSVCQAHENPDKYGVLGMAMKFIFPFDDKLHGKEMEIHTTHQTTYDEAAFNGAIGQDCNHIYKCFFDVLDLILYLKNHLFSTLSN